MKIIKASKLRAGDKFRIAVKRPLRTVKNIRAYSRRAISVDCGITTVTDLIILPKVVDVMLYSREWGTVKIR